MTERARFPRSPARVRATCDLVLLGRGPRATNGASGWSMANGRLFRCALCGYFMSDQVDECDTCFCGALHLDADAGRLGSDLGDDRIEVWEARPRANGVTPDAWRAARRDRIAGALLGTAVGDALGLPREGLAPARARRLLGDDLRHRFALDRGMVSDDTEHSCLLAQSLLTASDDPALLARSFARKLRFWMLGLPAGVGMGTARAIGKLWMGADPARSGVPSAGNGPAMRAPILGACCFAESESMASMVRAATRVTHTDERAERAALLVAFAAGFAATREPSEVRPTEFLAAARRMLWSADSELVGILAVMEAHLAARAPTDRFAGALGLANGVTGYAYHTVPVALYAWLSHPGDFRAAVSHVIRLGGDADTTGAIVGGICGAGVGASGIPREWVDGLWEWPRSVEWMNGLADRLARRFPDDGAPDLTVGEMPLFAPAVLPRNLLFLTIVLAHGFRRLLPPYGDTCDGPRGGDA